MKTIPVRCKCGRAWVKAWSDPCERCQKEEARHQERSRPRPCISDEKTAQRGYDGDWRVARQDCLRRAPWCVACVCRDRTLTPATVVDHVTPFHQVPAAEREAYRLESWNLQGLCTRHHDQEKSVVEHREHWSQVRKAWVRWLHERVLTPEARTLLGVLGLDEASEAVAREKWRLANT